MKKQRLLFTFFGVVLLLFGAVVLSDAFTLPDTGQTKCYNSSGTEISCTGTGQDGEYSINPMSYTDNGNGTITDNVTGLMWQKGENATYYNWYQASGTYDATNNPSSQNVCGSLTLGGYSDWRLPTKKELITIVDYSILYPWPTINTTYFPNANADFPYWSSTTDTLGTGYAWSVQFNSGWVSHSYETFSNYVRCVRAGQSSNNFTDNGNGTVTDNKTGLMWQKGEPGYMTWQNALNYCNGLSLGSQTDWRLPNVKELESITDDSRYNPAIDTTYFPNAYASHYWSSTTSADWTSDACFVDFNYGSVVIDNKPSSNYVRCVRGGQSGSLGNQISLPTSQQSFTYDPISQPVTNIDPSQAKPFGVGSVATGGDTLSLRVSLTQFAGPVDIYLAIYAPTISSDIWMIKSDLNLQPLSAGLVKWKANTTGPIDEYLYGNIPVSSLPAGTYYLYVVVTPSGSLNAYYLWSTNFTINGSSEFLSFPLSATLYPQGAYTPARWDNTLGRYTSGIISVLDHHMSAVYSDHDGYILSFTGELFQETTEYPSTAPQACYPKTGNAAWSSLLSSLYKGTGSNSTAPNNCSTNVAINYEAHPGYDYVAATGTSVYAAAKGTVVSLNGGCVPKGISNQGCADWGAVGIDHGNGYISQYLHLSRIMVSPGNAVAEGQQIGLSGNTSPVNPPLGPHLHFEVLRRRAGCSTSDYSVGCYATVDPYGFDTSKGQADYITQFNDNLPNICLWKGGCKFQ